MPSGNKVSKKAGLGLDRLAGLLRDLTEVCTCEAGRQAGNIPDHRTDFECKEQKAMKVSRCVYRLTIRSWAWYA